MKHDPEFGQATKRLAGDPKPTPKPGVKTLDRSRPFGQIYSTAGITGFRQDGIEFDLEGYEKQ